MMEWPETITVAAQWNEKHAGARVAEVELGHSPHKFFFTNGDEHPMGALLVGRRFGRATPLGMFLEFEAEDAALLTGDGISLRWLAPDEAPPEKRQLLLRFEDGSALTGSVQMYGSANAYPAGSCENPYYLAAKTSPPPLGGAFGFERLQELHAAAKPSESAKALLATKQRIPGLGNGCLHDILLHAGIHPKTKCAALGEAALRRLYGSLMDTLTQMTEAGGRSSERDLYGRPGGYGALLSSKTWKQPCPLCGGELHKENYLGGSVYYCGSCQPLGGGA